MEYSYSSNIEQIQPDNQAYPGGLGVEQNSVLRSKSSKYRGVQKIKDKETYVAHVYDNGHTPNESRTIYLGRFDKEENAARAHDLVSLKFWGITAMTNFPVENYVKELEAMENMSDQDVMASVRRSSNSFSRGKSKYRGVVGHTNSGKWQARKGPGKDSFLGTYETEEEAAIAFDIASIKQKGSKAITNFDINTYNVAAILAADNDSAEQEEVSGRRNKKQGHSSLRHFLSKNKAPVSSEYSRESPSGPSFGGPVDTSLSLGFKHSGSSAIPEVYQAGEASEDSTFLAPGFELWRPNLNPSYEASLFQDYGQEQGVVGFQHASSSCFQPFTRP